ncbi:hypothetical protein Bbelb_373700 [Branchiostoma belcheri]|nr:hypothetical protein Bbelb_373700 [Branchiostoma belcheri]
MAWKDSDCKPLASNTLTTRSYSDTPRPFNMRDSTDKLTTAGEHVYPAILMVCHENPTQGVQTNTTKLTQQEVARFYVNSNATRVNIVGTVFTRKHRRETSNNMGPAVTTEDSQANLLPLELG